MATKTAKNKTDTKTDIMDAAEELMALHGINGVSIRTILTKAGAHSAALHYYFRSREGLIQALLDRRGREISSRRLQMLTALESRDVPADIHDFVDTVVDPVIMMLQNGGEPGRRFMRFLARLQSDRAGIHRDEEIRLFPEIEGKLSRVLMNACPHVSPDELVRRADMMLDVMFQSLAAADFMTHSWKGDEHEEALRDYAATLKDFLAGGLSAPVRKRTK